MRKIKDVLRLKFDAGLSNRDIGNCLNIGPATVSEVLTRFKTSDLSWPLPESLSDQQLEGKLYVMAPAKRKNVCLTVIPPTKKPNKIGDLALKLIYGRTTYFNHVQFF